MTRYGAWPTCLSRQQELKSRRKWTRKLRPHLIMPRPAHSRQQLSSPRISSRRNRMPQMLSPADRPTRLDAGGRVLSFVDAVREATELEMARDHSVVVFGLDVDDPKA